MRIVYGILIVSSSVSLAVACGGSMASNSNGADSGVDSGRGTIDSGSLHDASGTKDSGSSSGSGMDSGSGSSGGGLPDAAAPSMGSVACGTTTCPAPAQVCCSGGGMGGGMGGGGMDTCGAAGSCGGDVYTCTGQANCAHGTVCCVTLGGGGMGVDIAQCETTCGSGDGTQQGDTAQVCQPNDKCPAGDTCQSGVGYFGENVCAPGGAVDAGGGG